MLKRSSVLSPIALFFCFLAFSAGLPAESYGQESGGENTVYDPALFQALKYRLIGPFRGGRVTAVAGVRKKKHTFYMGSTGGGVWKTTDGGERWINISDGFFEAASIGAVRVSQSDPNVIYVGTGSSPIRGNVSPGIGMYKSTDAGETWQHSGLRGAGQIGAIRIHPDNSDLVYVAVLGHAFGPNEERGVFRSKDGGRSWERVLYISEKTGAIDLSMVDSDPGVLYAAMWTAERKPWTIISGSNESGLFKTTDGGDTWEKLGGGLPEDVVGKVGVSASGANPNRVWALVEAEEGGVYRSDDAGKTWERLNRERGLRARPWYYTHIHADPQDENVVYISSEDFWRSEDGGVTYELIPVPHGDTHDLWINPDDNEILIESNDGGANVTYNRCLSWSTIMNQPTAEFYRVTTDNQVPYRVYAAQQDNSTLSLPSRTNRGGITVQHMFSVAGGESGHIAVDPRNPDITYAGSFGGTLTRRDRGREQTRDIMVYPELAAGQAPRNLRYRVQWNAPIRISPHNPDVLYFGSQHVHKSTNEGQSWETISPDLTYNDPEVQDFSGGPVSRDGTGVEVFGTVFALEESPHAPGLLWVGSDDGRVHISRDGGQNWQDITPEGIGRWGTVNMIDLSAHDPGRAFIAVQRYRLDDFKPYVFRTNDYGQSWELLTDGTNGIPENHFVRVVREDPDRKGLLYAGSEFGMYISFDDGAHWQSFLLNLPVTPITDMVVKTQDLVVSTQGRSLWILDDLTPLHQIDDEVAQSAAFLFEPRDTYRLREGSRRRGGNTNTFRDRYDGAALDWDRVGEDAPAGAVFRYYLASAPSGDVTIEILESGGSVIQTFTSESEDEERKVPKDQGMNRYAWDLRYPDADIIENTSFRGTTRGPMAIPGTYQVKLTVEGRSQAKSFQLLKAPRVEATQADLQEQFDMLMTLRDAITETYDAIRAVRDLRGQITEVTQSAGTDVKQAGDDLSKKLTEIELELIEPRIEYREDCWNFPSKLNHFLAYLAQKVATADFKPTDASHERFKELRGMLDEQLGKLKLTLDTNLDSFNGMLQEKGLKPLTRPSP